MIAGILKMYDIKARWEEENTKEKALWKLKNHNPRIHLLNAIFNYDYHPLTEKNLTEILNHQP